MIRRSLFFLVLIISGILFSSTIIKYGFFNYAFLMFGSAVFLTIAYRQVVSNASNKTLVLSSVYFIYIVGIVLVLLINAVSVSKGSEEFPFLPGDGLDYFLIALEIANQVGGLKGVSLNYIGYPLVLSGVFGFFGPYLIYGLLLNLFLLFFNVLLVARSAYLVFHDRRVYDFSVYILLGMAQFMATGFMLLKDGFIVLSVTLSLYSGACFFRGGSFSRSVSLVSIAIVIMALFRSTLLFVPIFVFLLFAFEKKKKVPLYLIAIIPILVLGFSVSSQFGLKERSLQDNLEFATSNTVISRRVGEETSGTVSALLGGYNNWSLVRKLIFLPVSSAIQYITPFDVLNFASAFDFPYYLISKNFHILWLVYIGPLFLFSVIMTVVRPELFDKVQVRLLLMGVFLYLIPAYIYGGAIPRYAVPFLTLLVPIVAKVIVVIKDRKSERRLWHSFMLVLYCSFVGLFFLYFFSKYL